MEVLFIATAILGVGSGVFLSVDLALSVRMLPNPENVGKDIAVMALANTLPSSVVPFIAPLFLLLGGYTALYIGLAVFGVVGALLVTRLPELGHEGNPRWALITKSGACGGSRLLANSKVEGPLLRGPCRPAQREPPAMRSAMNFAPPDDVKPPSTGISAPET